MSNNRIKILLHQYLLCCLLFPAFTTRAQNADIDILRSINRHETPFKNGFSNAVAGSVTVVNIAAPVTVFTIGLAKKNKQLQIDAAYMAGGYLLSTIITQGSKRLIKRDRPFITYTDITKRAEGGGYSFPSGHTASAFYSATSLSLYYPKWYVIVPCYTWASAVAYARMYQGVHYPSDVLVGAVVGAGSAWISYKVQHWMEKKSNKTTPAAKPAL